MTPAADFHGNGDLPAVPGERAANAFALVASRSTSAYMFVVLMLARPSHPRIVLILTPALRRCVAVECRIVCGLTLFESSDRLTAKARTAFIEWLNLEAGDLLRCRSTA
jgi:hypothetical protein